MANTIRRSPAPMDDDDDEGKANGAAAPKKFTKLSDCVPKASAVALFGSTDFTVQSATQHRFALKRIPILYVYVVSTNPSHAAYLVSLFKGFPCVLYGLSVCDFVLSKPRSISPAVDTLEQNDANKGISATTTTSTINVYSGIGVDRVASVVGAGNLFPKASHILLIDGGSALTYTTAAEVPSSSTTSQSDLQLGGGICPGLQMRLRALYDYSTDLPLVDHTVITELLSECTERKKPLPVFTSAPMSSSDKSSSTNENDNERIIVKSMLACITTEMALLLCCIIRKWLLIPRRQPTAVSSSTTTISDDDLHRLPTVVITGGDGVYYEKLLRRNHSYICETNDTNVELLNHGITDDDINQRGLNGITVSNKSFILQRKSYLQHYGIKDVFMKNAVSRTAENEHVETIRNQLLGLRVKLNVNQQMGTIFAVQRGKDLDGDSYIVIFDVSQKIYSLCIDHVYGMSNLAAQNVSCLTLTQYTEPFLNCLNPQTLYHFTLNRNTSPKLEMIQSKLAMPINLWMRKRRWM
jgi:Type III pantothenate kinase